jgi:ABC-type phosphate transport system substrate-binding protein
LNDYNSEVFPAQVASGSLVTGTVYTIYSAGTTNWTSVGAMANMTGITFTATGTASGTGTAILAQSSGETTSQANPDVIATVGTAYAANTYGGQPNPIVTINNA